jgi:hypothetical protein
LARLADVQIERDGRVDVVNVDDVGDAGNVELEKRRQAEITSLNVKTVSVKEGSSCFIDQITLNYVYGAKSFDHDDTSPICHFVNPIFSDL